MIISTLYPLSILFFFVKHFRFLVMVLSILTVEAYLDRADIAEQENNLNSGLIFIKTIQ